MANLGFDASTVDPSSIFEPLPAGAYTCVITESEIKPTQAGTGHYLKLTFRVIEGEHTNRLIFDNLNIDNPSAQAKEIALRALSAICHATGVIKVADSSALHGIPLVVAVKMSKDQNGDLVNVIKGYKGVSGADGAAPRATPPTGSPASAPRTSAAGPAATPPSSWPAAQAPAAPVAPAAQAPAAPAEQAPAAPVAPAAQAPAAPLAATPSEDANKAPWM